MCREELVFKILEGKENRVIRQNEILKLYKSTLISFTLNIPGLIKTSDKYKKVLLRGIDEIKKTLMLNNIEILYNEVNERESGYEFFCAIQESGMKVKKLMIELEEKLSVGRIFDIDVFNSRGELLSRSNFNIGKRKCLVCDREAVICSRSRAHDIEEVIEALDKLVEEFILEEGL